MHDAPNIRTLTVSEISRLTSISPGKVRDLVASGYFPKVPIPGRTVRVLERDVISKLSGVDCHESSIPHSMLESETL
jgi:excisionase family DNA binding protein